MTINPWPEFLERCQLMWDRDRGQYWKSLTDAEAQEGLRLNDEYLLGKHGWVAPLMKDAVLIYRPGKKYRRPISREGAVRVMLEACYLSTSNRWVHPFDKPQFVEESRYAYTEAEFERFITSLEQSAAGECAEPGEKLVEDREPTNQEILDEAAKAYQQSPASPPADEVARLTEIVRARTHRTLGCICPDCVEDEYQVAKVIEELRQRVAELEAEVARLLKQWEMTSDDWSKGETRIKELDDEVFKLQKTLKLVEDDARVMKACWNEACHDVGELKDKLTTAEAERGRWEATARDRSPKAECYDRICQELEVSNDCIGAIRKLKAERDAALREVESATNVIRSIPHTRYTQFGCYDVCVSCGGQIHSKECTLGKWLANNPDASLPTPPADGAKEGAAL